jgi:hypothetical protein
MGSSDAGDNSGSSASVSKQDSADTKDINKSDVSASDKASSDKASSDKASSGQNGKQQKPKPNPEASGNTAASGATTSKVTKNDRSSDNDGQTVDGTEEPESSTRFSIGGNIMGILAKDLWTSPDGGFTVEINDGHLYLYQNNADSINGRKLITDKPIDGVWVQGSWSEDSKSYQYEIEKDNVTSTYTLQAKAETDVTDPSVNNDQSQKNTTK